MNVTINNFHDIRNLSLRVEAGQSLHVAGKSGCGKSGIFEAILWCFYGVTRGVEPRSNQAACVTVSVKFDDSVAITRAKNKKLLRFESPEGSVEGDLAQVKINDYFQCDREGWIATSYVIQEKMHFIFTLPAADRYNMLLRLSMHGEDAEKRMKKLNECMKKASTEYAAKSSEYQRSLAEYEELCEKYGVGFECALSTEKTLNLTNQVTGYSTTLQDLSTELDEAKTHQLRRETHLKSQARLQREHSKVVSYSETGLANLEERLKLQRRKKKLQEEKTTLCAQLEKIEKKLAATTPACSLPIPSAEQLQDIQHRERLYRDELAKADALKVEYAKEIVDAEVREVEALLAEQEQATLVHLARVKSERLQQCVQELPPEPALPQAQLVKNLSALIQEEKQHKTELAAELERSVESAKERLAQDLEKVDVAAETEREQLARDVTIKKEELREKCAQRSASLVVEQEKFDAQLLALERSREVHSCPHCSGSIRYVRDTIEKSDDQPFDEEKFRDLERHIVRIEEEISQVALEEKEKLSAFDLELRSALAAQKKEVEARKAALHENHNKKVKLWERNLKKEFGDRIDAIQGEVNTLQRTTETWTTRLRLLDEIARLRTDLEALPEPTAENATKLTPKEVEKAKARLGKLRTLSFHEKPPVSYAEYQTIIKHKKYTAQRLELTSKIALVQASLLDLGNVAEEPVDTNTLREYRDQLSTQKTLVTQLNSVASDLAKIPETRPVTEVEKEVKKYQRLKSRCEAQLSNSKKACALIQRYDEIEALHDVCTALNIRMIEYERFAAIIKEKIVDCITELIVFTNNYLEQIAKVLFDAPISIELSTEKQFKSGSTRQEINLVIHYRGGQVYNYESGLSGGEKARINAMLTLAFARYIDSKILIFDEVVSFLDDKKAQQLMDIVHDPELGVPGRFILLASQNCSSGLVHATREYDSFLA